MSPFFEINKSVRKRNTRYCDNAGVKEDKPWFNDECKRLYRNYITSLNVFNHSKSGINHANLNEAKRKYKLCENRLKRLYKRQQGNMLEGLRVTNPKLFYRKFSNKRKVSAKVPGKEFFEHFKRLASDVNF